MTYFMLTGRFPYGTDVAKSLTVKAQGKLRYIPAPSINQKVPHWIDYALKNAVRIEPEKRYQEVSEFLFDLKVPNPKVKNVANYRLPRETPCCFGNEFLSYCRYFYLSRYGTKLKSCAGCPMTLTTRFSG